MSFQVLFILLGNVLFSASTPLKTKFLLDFFEYHAIKTIILFDCSIDNSDLATTIQYLSKTYNGSFRVINIAQDSINLDFPQVLRSNENDVGLAIGTECPQIEHLFTVMSENHFFNGSYEWLLFEDATSLLCRQNLNMDSRVTVAIADPIASNTIELYDIYNTLFRRGGKFHVQLMGSWNVRNGFAIRWEASQYERRRDFGGIEIRVVFSDIRRKHNETILQRLESKQPLEGFSLWRFAHYYTLMASIKHNYRIHYIHTPDWGRVGQNISSGMIGQLKTHDADLSVNALYIHEDRIPYVDVGVVIAEHRPSVVFRHPKHDHAWKTVLEPFNAATWYGLITSLSLAAVILGVIFRIQQKNIDFLTIFGFVCQQGYSSITVLVSAKVVILVSLLCSVLVYQFYSACTMRSLLSSSPKDINTIRKLINSNIKVAIEDTFFLWEFYKRSNNPEALELFNKKIHNGPEKPTDVITGLKKVKMGGYALQCDTTYAYPIIKRTFSEAEICELQGISIYSKELLQMPLAKGSPLKQYYRVTLRKAIESGSGPRYLREYFSLKPPCPRDVSRQLEPIDLVRVESIFCLLAVAMLACWVMLLLERLHHRYVQRRQVIYFLD